MARVDMKWGGVYRSGSKEGRAQGGKYTETLTSLVPTADVGPPHPNHVYSSIHITNTYA